MKDTNIIIGKKNTGKTKYYLFDEVKDAIKNGDNLCIFDTRDEYFRTFSNELKNNGYNVLTLNLNDPARSNGYNPLQVPYELYKEGKKDKAIELVNNLASTSGEIVTLYAIYSRERYFHSGNYVFDGTNYIDTGIRLFDEKNVNRNFEVSFEIIERGSNANQATLMNSIDESGSPWPGFVYRMQNQNQYEICANVAQSVSVNPKYTASSTSKVVLRRINNKFYCITNDGKPQELVDYSGLVAPFDAPLSIGASLDVNGNPQRYFVGTLSDVKITIFE
jgi:predicted ATP-dependent endonuclease of OLD family